MLVKRNSMCNDFQMKLVLQSWKSVNKLTSSKLLGARLVLLFWRHIFHFWKNYGVYTSKLVSAIYFCTYLFQVHFSIYWSTSRSGNIAM